MKVNLYPKTNPQNNISREGNTKPILIKKLNFKAFAQAVPVLELCWNYPLIPCTFYYIQNCRYHVRVPSYVHPMFRIYVCILLLIYSYKRRNSKHLYRVSVTWEMITCKRSFTNQNDFTYYSLYNKYINM